MNVLKYTVFIFLFLIITNVRAIKIETDLEKLSYSMGIFFGQTVNRQEMEIDIPAFMQAVEDVLNNAEKKLTDDEMQKIINAYQKKEKEEEITKSANSKIEGEKFLAENKNFSQYKFDINLEIELSKFIDVEGDIICVPTKYKNFMVDGFYAVKFIKND